MIDLAEVQKCIAYLKENDFILGTILESHDLQLSKRKRSFDDDGCYFECKDCGEIFCFYPLNEYTPDDVGNFYVEGDLSILKCKDQIIKNIIE